MKAVKVAAASVLLPLAMMTGAPQAHAQDGDMYYELQLLRDEIRQMSGRIEELDHELSQLKQRQQEDYRDLDRRISLDAGGAEMGGGVAASEAPGPIPVTPPSEPSATGDVGAAAGTTIPQARSQGQAQGQTQGQASQNVPVDSDVPLVESAGSEVPVADLRADREQYEAAYDLLRRRRMDDSAQAFQAYVNDHPQGRFVANAYYWLGEIYLLQNKLDEAEDAFVTVKENFSGDQKAEDAAYKLGRVYHLQGEDTKARATLEAVASGSSNTAQLARDYLRDNF